MNRDSAIPSEAFEEILAWLNSDRERAGLMYVQLRHDLARMFSRTGCCDPEGLTDEVIDRVSRKVHDLRPTYVGDARFYFRGVANNLIKETLKKIKTYVSLEGIDLPKPRASAIEADTAELEDCLQSCLQKLSAEKRELIMAYYAKEKQAKIDHRLELARSLGISVRALRVKVFRIRLSLERCIERSLKRKAQGIETDCTNFHCK